MSKKNLNGKNRPSDQSVEADIATTGESFEADEIHGPALRHELAQMRRNPEAIRELFLTGRYPYNSKIPTQDYERKKRRSRWNC